MTQKINLASTHLSPEIEFVLRDLVLLTQRTSFICELLQIEWQPERVGRLINKMLEQLGANVPSKRPRGRPTQYDASGFLGSMPERLEASVLLALHRAGPGGGRSKHLLDMSVDPLERVRMLTTSYQQYVNNAVGEGTPRISFEGYHALLCGINDGAVVVRRCSCCGARHVHSTQLAKEPNCPFCARDAAQLQHARTQLKARQDARSQARDEASARRPAKLAICA
jgi:hypothetical protein